MSTYDASNGALIPNCPSCGAKMVNRIRKADNSPFFGCGRYPDCKKTLSLAKGEELARSQQALLKQNEEGFKSGELAVLVDNPFIMHGKSDFMYRMLNEDIPLHTLNNVNYGEMELKYHANVEQFTLPPRPPVKTKSNTKPTNEQIALRDFMLDGDKDDLLGEAYAGTGKSTTFGKFIMPELPRRAKKGYFAFGSKNAKDFRSKYKMPASTFHAFGKSQLERAFGDMQDLNGNMKRDFARILLPEGTVIGKTADGKPRYATRAEWSMLSKLCSMVQNTWTHMHSEVDIMAMIDTYSMDMDNLEHLFVPLVPKVLDMCIGEWEKNKIMDFDFMQWGALYYHRIEGKHIIIPEYDYAGIDECQDLTLTQILLATELIKDTGRLMFIGDRWQAIYGWRGSLVNSIDVISEHAFNINILPLSICFRSAKSHIEQLAKPLVPWIRSHEDNPDGTIRSNVPLDRCVKEWAELETSLTLCRINAPLVKNAYKLLKSGRKATILGKDFANGLISLIERMNAYDINELIKKLQEYRNAEVEKLNAANKESQAEALSDKVECIIEITDGTLTIPALIKKIDSLFHDDPSPGAIFGTYYRAKGMESDDVYLLEPSIMPFPKAPRYNEPTMAANVTSHRTKEDVVEQNLTLSDTIKQERNGMYIVGTRSSMNFTTIDGEFNVELGASITREELSEGGEDYDDILNRH